MTQRPEGYRKFEADAVFDALEAFEGQAQERGVSMAGLALAWLLARARGDGDHRRADAGPSSSSRLGRRSPSS